MTEEMSTDLFADLTPISSDQGSTKAEEVFPSNEKFLDTFNGIGVPMVFRNRNLVYKKPR